jgi:hypothetical protein
LYSKQFSNDGAIARVKINANNYLSNAENLITRGLPDTLVVAYENYHCNLKAKDGAIWSLTANSVLILF